MQAQQCLWGSSTLAATLPGHDIEFLGKHAWHIAPSCQGSMAQASTLHKKTRVEAHLRAACFCSASPCRLSKLTGASIGPAPSADDLKMGRGTMSMPRASSSSRKGSACFTAASTCSGLPAAITCSTQPLHEHNCCCNVDRSAEKVFLQF